MNTEDRQFLEALKAHLRKHVSTHSGGEEVVLQDVEDEISAFAASWRPAIKDSLTTDTSPEALRALAFEHGDETLTLWSQHRGLLLRMSQALEAVAAEKEAQALEYISLFGQTQEALDRIAELESKLGAEQCRAASMEALAVKRAEMRAKAEARVAELEAELADVRSMIPRRDALIDKLETEVERLRGEE